MRKIETLEEIKQIELRILKNVDEFCRAHGLKYSLAYGTLIGAVRHNGFIPWDDDIDIWMLREDYDIFSKKFPDWGKKKQLYIAGPDSKEHYLPRHMLKVCDAKTLLIENTYEDYRKIGVFIDIFPLDRVPPNKVYSKFWVNYIRTYKYRSLASVISLDSSAYKSFNRIKKFITRILKNADTMKTMSTFVRKSGRYKNSTSNQVTVFYSLDPVIFKCSDIFPPSVHSFEDLLLFIPRNYDKLLRMIYGDYMVFPAENKRMPMHTSEAYYLSEHD